MTLFKKIFPAGSAMVMFLCSVLLLLCTEPVGPSNVTNFIASLQFNGPGYEGDYYDPGALIPKTDWCIWIEDANNQYIKTLAINIGIVKYGYSGRHAKHLPNWLACTGDSIKDPPTPLIPTRFDGITTASFDFDSFLPETTVTAEWDFTDTAGTLVPEGTYYFRAEVTNIVKNVNKAVIDTIINGDTTFGYFPIQLLNQVSIATVTYPTGEVTNSTATTNIKAFTGETE